MAHAKLEGATVNLRYLHTFVSIVDSGSIARASARLNVSQPAASRQILALEAELGVPLFDRIGRRLRLTSQGEDLLQQSRRLLMEADVLREREHSRADTPEYCGLVQRRWSLSTCCQRFWASTRFGTPV